jgi:hypothetical protein
MLCNENQIDALFILNLFRQSTSTCFGHVYCPSSRGIHCICTAIGTCYTFKLTGCWPGIPHDDEQLACPTHVEVDWRNKLKINIASIWFSLQRISRCTVMNHRLDDQQSDWWLTYSNGGCSVVSPPLSERLRNTYCLKGFECNNNLLPIQLLRLKHI